MNDLDRIMRAHYQETFGAFAGERPAGRGATGPLAEHLVLPLARLLARLAHPPPEPRALTQGEHR